MAHGQPAQVGVDLGHDAVDHWALRAKDVVAGRQGDDADAALPQAAQ
jgi:hypothetical protein